MRTMAWLRVQLTEEQRCVVNEERTSHPNERIRERMLVLWLLHNGVTRQKTAEIVGVGRPSSVLLPRFATEGWMACGDGTPIDRKARWPRTASRFANSSKSNRL